MRQTLSAVAQCIAPSVTLKLNAQVAQMKQQGLQVISLGAGEPDFDTPAHICTAAKEAIDLGRTRYTDVAGLPQLRQCIAETLYKSRGVRYEPREILVGAGVKQVLFDTLQALIDPGDEVIVFSPYWVSYPPLIRMTGVRPVMVRTLAENGFLPTPAQISAAVTPRTKAVIVNTPGNPTGTVWPRALLEELMEIASHHQLYVISDEIYEKLIYDGHTHVSPAALSEDAFRRTIVVSGLSKSYAMTGWRVGYAAGPRELIAAMTALQSHASGNCCTISQHAALEALSASQECVQRMAQSFDDRRKKMLACLQNEHLMPAAVPQGAFYLLLDVRPYAGKTLNDQPVDDDIAFCELLLAQEHVAIVPGTPFGAQGFVRLSYAAKEDDIAEGIRRIGHFVQSLQ